MKNESQIQESTQLVENLSFCVIDLETTGGNQSYDKIIEIGLVKVEGLEIISEKNILIDPEIPIPEFIQKLTSIKQKDIEGCSKIEDEIAGIIEFIGDSILVAHNISFDIPFLNSVLRRLKMKELENKVICTNVMTKYLIPEIMNSNLNYLSQLFGITHNKAHRASDDAKATAELLLNYLDIYIEKGIRKVNQLYYPRNKFELDRINFQTEDSNLEEIKKTITDSPSPMVVSLKGDQGVLLAVIPLLKCSKEVDFVINLMDKLPWKVLTLKLVGSLLEGLTLYDLHYNKFEDDIKEEITKFLMETHSPESTVDPTFLNSLDFVITPHLIKEQFIIYNFLNFNTNSKLIFKYPGHKKKFQQYVNNQKKRFKSYQKEKKKHKIHRDVFPIINNFLQKEFENKKSQYHFLTLKDLKEKADKYLVDIDNYTQKRSHLFPYPKKHL